jgi:hypothetical protein
MHGWRRFAPPDTPPFWRLSLEFEARSKDGLQEPRFQMVDRLDELPGFPRIVRVLMNGATRQKRKCDRYIGNTLSIKDTCHFLSQFPCAR